MALRFSLPALPTTGKITLGGSTHSLNADFSSLTLLLASNLNVSPRFCASLLQAALASRSRWPSRSPVEIALILYHRERWALTEAWKLIAEGAITLTQEQGPARARLGLKLSQALQSLLALRVSNPKTHRDETFPVRVLSELDFLKEQAASVETALKSAPPNSSQRLPDEIQLERLAAIRRERRSWGHVLYLLCISAMLDGEELVAIAQWMSKIKEGERDEQRDQLLPYVLSALLAGLETSARSSIEGTTGPGYPDLLQDRAVLGKLNTIINTTTWATTSLQAVVQLQWCLLLVQVVQADPHIASELHVTEESVSQAVTKAAQKGDAFVYIVVRLLGWKQQMQDALEGTDDEENNSANKLAEPSSGFFVDGEDEVDAEFQQYLLDTLQSLLVGVSRTFLPVLRRIQRQEEDAAYSTSRSGGQSPRRFDLEAYLDSIALVARGDTQKSMQFWLAPDGRRSRFLLWAIELREDGHQRALLDLLSALASGGGEGAWQAHALLSSPQDDASDEGLVSWTRLWDWLGYYVEALRRPAANAREQASIPPSEVSLLRSFLGLLRGVVASSFAARESLLSITLNSVATGVQQNQNPFGLPSSSTQSSTGTTVLRRLFAMYTCPVPTELKATILDVLAAFAKDPPPGSGTPGKASQVRQELWALLEGSDVLGATRPAPQRTGFSHGFGLRPAAQPQQPQAGVLFELHNVESPSGFYPGTISFINFLASLVVPDVKSASGRAAGDVEALVADLPSGSALPQQSLQPLGAAPASGNTAAAASPPGPADIGLEKYLAFVTDAVFMPTVASASNRDFASPSEKWRVIASCLAFYDRCLAAFDLTSLEATIGNAGTRGADDRDTLLRLAVHPGFGVMKRMMGTTKFFREVMQTLVPQLDLNASSAAPTSPGYEIVDSPAGKKVFFVSVAVRNALRLVLRSMKGQDLFLQVLLPTLAGLVETDVMSKAQSSLPLPAGLDLESRIGQNASYSSIDSKLLQEYDSVVQIALYVNSSRDDLALLGVQLLAAIAASGAFSEVDRFSDGVGGAGRRRLNRLVGLLEMTDESSRLREGVVRRLDALVDSKDVGILVPDSALGDSEDNGDDLLQGTSAHSFGGDESICRSILDLLLTNLQISKTAPNIAHLLLGFDLRAVKAEEQVILQPGQDTPRGALHALLDLLRGGQGDEDDDGDVGEGHESLLRTHPALAEKALSLLVSLATHSFTSSSTLRYLRNQENFWAAQVRENFAAYIEPIERGPADELSESDSLARGSVVYPDGRSVTSSVDALVASLQSRTHLLTGIAIELHGLVAAGMIPQAAELTAALFGDGLVIPTGSSGSRTLPSDRDSILAEHQSSAHRDRSGAGLRLLELLRSFDFEWHDDRDDIASQLEILGSLDIQQARSSDSASTSREFDIGKTIALLAFAKRELERQGELHEPRRRAAFDREAAVVLQYVSCRNAHRAIAAARRNAFSSWKSVHDLALSHSSLLFRPETRSAVVFDCLGALLPRLEGPQPDEDPILADMTAGAILALLTTLRKHRAALVSANDLTGATALADDLPVDRLLLTLRALTNALLRTGISVSARGHLYSALINYLQLAKAAPLQSDGASDGMQQSFLGDDSSSVLGTNDFNDAASASFSLVGSLSDGRGNEGSRHTSILEQRTRSLLVGHAERLVSTIARDALDAPDVWRTVAFTLLDKLVALESSGSGHSARPVSLDVLSRGGFLKSFVARLRDMDLDLQEALRPDPSSLNALYVYEAQFSFLARLAQSSQGAEKLLDAKLFEVLAQADYLAARPDQDQDFVDLESFLPAATERFGALLRPALQVSVSIVNVAASYKKRTPVIGYGNVQKSDSHVVHTSLQQALALLNAHRDSFLGVLSSAVEDITSIATLEQAQLIVTLLLQILPILDDDALTPPQPLAALHTAVLALAAGFLHSTAWQSRVVPFTDVEREMEETAAPSFKIASLSAESALDADAEYESEFDVAASLAVSHLNMSVLSYLEAVSETYGHSGDHRGVRPCFTATLAVPQPFVSARSGADGLGASRRSLGPGSSSSRLASVASLGIALAALDEQVALLEADLQQSERIKGMLDSSENVRLEEWDSVTRQALQAAPALAKIGDLGLGQRRSIAVRALKSQVARIKARSAERFDAIDLALVLIYRHFAFYLSLASANTSASLSQSVDDFAAPWRAGKEGSKRGVAYAGGSALAASNNSLDATTLLNDGSQMVQLVLERLGRVLIAMNTAPSVSGSTRERSAFLELVGRKLQSLLMVRDGEGMGRE